MVVVFAAVTASARRRVELENWRVVVNEALRRAARRRQRGQIMVTGGVIQWRCNQRLVVEFTDIGAALLLWELGSRVGGLNYAPLASITRLR